MNRHSEAVVGWAADASQLPANRSTTSVAIVRALRALGVREAFGIIGAGIAPFVDALAHEEVQIRHFRHEAGAAFAATEAHFASGRPTVLFATTGPGLYNALTGIAAARADGARLIVISGATSPVQRGRGAVQETHPGTMPSELFTQGTVFHQARLLEDPSELDEFLARLTLGLQRPSGFVAHLSLPLSFQTAPRQRTEPPSMRFWSAGVSEEALDECAALLATRRFGVWAGFGARNAGRQLLGLVERTGCSVICSPRAKGLFPETHPRYVGVSGAGGHDSVEQYMAGFQPEHLLVLGTRLGEVTSFWSDKLRPTTGLIHVDLEPEAFGGAYPRVPTLSIQAETGVFLERLLARLPARAPLLASDARLLPPPRLAPRSDGPVRPQFLMQAVQEKVVEASDALVMTESGNSFTWGNHLLRFEQPNRYRTSAAFGSMGHFVTGVVGAALARAGKAVALVGDGAMLMNNEVNTAVKYGAPAVWIVLNDAQLGLTEHGMRASGFTPVETQLPRTDFVAFARSMGADGLQVTEEHGLPAALEAALAATGPFVVDVHVDPSVPSPILQRRIASVLRQSVRNG